MRYILLLICLGLIGGLGWFALTRGSDGPNLRGAPQIQAMTAARVNQALANAGEEGLSVDIDGRTVTLSGLIAGDARRAEVMGALRQVALVSAIVDKTITVEAVDPYTLVAQKFPLGEIKIKGHIPSRTTEQAILASARAAAKGAQVDAELLLAAGVPDGDWTGMVTAGMRALSGVSEGTLNISGLNVTVTGSTPDSEATGIVVSAAEGAPLGDWSLDIDEELPIADPFVFSALKTQNGSIAIRGNMPSEAVGAALRDVAEAASSEAVSGELELARGMPGPEWPELVARAITALASIDSGLLNVTDMSVSLEGEIQDESGRLALDEIVSSDWELAIKVLDPGPVGDVTFTLDRSGALAVAGILPENLSAEDLSRAIDNLNTDAIVSDRTGKEVSWEAPLEALELVLPRLRDASLRVIHRRFFLSGHLKRGFSASASETAIRAAFPPGWDINVTLTESLPLPELNVSLRDENIELNGVLPTALTPDEALTVFGDSAGGEALVSGGDGDPDAWRKMLANLSQTLGFFREATGRADSNLIELTGTLAPGYESDTIAEWLTAQLSDTWKVAVEAETTAANDGDQRLNLRSGQTEVFTNGFWIAEATFAVSAPVCAAETEAVLGEEQINFLPSSTRLEQGSDEVLNRIASIAVRCLNGTGMRLEIGGHTDSVGNQRRNLKLSEERAKAVLEALVTRGLSADVAGAAGFGETQPIAPNNTAEGRAQNRRIEFSWIPADE